MKWLERLKAHQAANYVRGQACPSDYETATGRKLYTVSSVKSAYRQGVEDCIEEAKEWAARGGDYSLLAALQSIKDEVK